MRSILTIVLLLAVFSITLSAQKPHKKPYEQPSVLMIAIDDLNDWVGFMNAHPNALPPNLDKLAARGTVFTNAHAAAPLCGPTRAALLSGFRAYVQQAICIDSQE